MNLPRSKIRKRVLGIDLLLELMSAERKSLLWACVKLLGVIALAIGIGIGVVNSKNQSLKYLQICITSTSAKFSQGLRCSQLL